MYLYIHNLGPRLLTAAITLALGAPVATSQAALLDIVESNFEILDAEAITNIYPVSPTAGDPNGYLVIDAKEDVVRPGIDIYQEGYRSGETTFNGCIMAKKDPLLVGPDDAGTCKGEVDTGKRFKLRNYGINKHMDIQFTVSTVNQVDPDTAEPLTLLYNVYGKLTNDGGTPATGFEIRLGTGIGDNFVPSDDTDGISLKTYQTLDDAQVWVGKYPGGLFGGSPAEGLPFFSTESAYYLSEQEGDLLATTAVPSQYYDVFGLWQTLANVPGAWLYDDDGRPWTDGKLQAYDEKGTWYTFKKVWATDSIALALEDFTDANNQDPIDWTLLPQDLNPLLNPYVDLGALTEWMNTEAGLTGDSAIRIQQVVDALLTFLKLEREAVDQATLDAWAGQPVTVRFSADPNITEPSSSDAAGWPLVATWHQDLGEEGLYVLDPTYANDPAFAGLTETLGDGSGRTVVTADNMATVVKDNTGLQTDFFGIPGYFEDVIEDLSNVNTAFAIEVGPDAAPTGPKTLTLRITLVDTGDQVQPDDGDSSTDSDGDSSTDSDGDSTDSDGDSSDGSNGGCSITGGKSPVDPILPLLVLAGLAGLGLRRRMISD